MFHGIHVLVFACQFLIAYAACMPLTKGHKYAIEPLMFLCIPFPPFLMQAKQLQLTMTFSLLLRKVQFVLLQAANVFYICIQWRS